MPAPIRTALKAPISTGRPTAAVVTAPRQAKMIIAIRTAASLRRVVAVMANVVSRSHRPLALDGDAGAGAGMRPVIPHRPVLGAAVVPERDRVFAPAEAALEQRVFRVLVEIGENGITLVARDANDVTRKTAIDIERLLARHRMGAHHGMLG